MRLWTVNDAKGHTSVPILFRDDGGKINIQCIFFGGGYNHFLTVCSQSTSSDVLALHEIWKITTHVLYRSYFKI